MISVIIPVYNRARYIKECLESVFNQTYKDYEVIVVDDGSTDNLKQVLVPYKGRINYIYKQNGGAASARNVGLRNAKGGYIAWLDSDDRWLPFKLELQKEILDKLPENVGFICSDFSCLNEITGERKASYIRDYCFTLESYRLEFNKMYSSCASLNTLGIELNKVPKATNVYWGDISSKVILGYLFLTSTILLKKKCADAVGYFNESYRTAEDYHFHVRVAKKYDVAYLDLPTIEYRRFHQDQLSSDKMELGTNLAWLRITNELGVEDKEYYSKHKVIVDMRIAQANYAVGVGYFKRKDYKNAIKYFLISVNKKKTQKRIYLYLAGALILSFLKGKDHKEAVV